MPHFFQVYHFLKTSSCKIAKRMSYLSLHLAQNSKLEIGANSVFIEGCYQFWGLICEKMGELEE